MPGILGHSVERLTFLGVAWNVRQSILSSNGIKFAFSFFGVMSATFITQSLEGWERKHIGKEPRYEERHGGTGDGVGSVFTSDPVDRMLGQRPASDLAKNVITFPKVGERSIRISRHTCCSRTHCLSYYDSCQTWRSRSVAAKVWTTYVLTTLIRIT